MASSSSAAGPGEETPSVFVPTGHRLVMYDRKKGDKTDRLMPTFRMFGGCSGEAAKTELGNQLSGLTLLKFDDVERAAEATRIWQGREIDKTRLNIYDFDGKKEYYTGLVRRGKDYILKVKRLKWVEVELKINN